jgi:hypothetical protein
MPECTVLKPDYEDRPNEPYRLDYLGFRQVEHIENYKDQLAKYCLSSLRVSRITM